SQARDVPPEFFRGFAAIDAAERTRMDVLPSFSNTSFLRQQPTGFSCLLRHALGCSSLPPHECRSPMSTCLIALGSNLGDRETTIAEAIAEIKSIAGVALVRHSRCYATQAIGMGESRSEFLNAAALCETKRSPAVLLECLKAIESRHGRQRLQRW